MGNTVVIEPLKTYLEKQVKDNGQLLQDNDGHILLTGEIELVIPGPINIKMASKLYNILQTIPEVRVTVTRGTINHGATIVVSIDKQIPFIQMLSTKLPDVKLVTDSPGDGRLITNNKIKNIMFLTQGS